MGISKYDLRQWGYFALAIAAVMPVGMFILYVQQTGLLGDNVWVKFAVFLGLGGLVWALSLLWWRSIDDVHRQGHLNSWYWGGNFGSFVFLLWLIASNTHSSQYGLGAFHVIVFQLTLGLVLYIFWKLRGSVIKGGAFKGGAGE